METVKLRMCYVPSLQIMIFGGFLCLRNKSKRVEESTSRTVVETRDNLLLLIINCRFYNLYVSEKLRLS
jgi:hypothetical protein